MKFFYLINNLKLLLIIFNSTKKMQTILWLAMTIIILICLLLVLYFYLAHDDLQRGKISIFELANNVECLIPLEIFLHFVVSIAIIS